jgi:hypothetical protein
MDVIQAKSVNANANTFKFFEVPASVARAANAERFELAA